MLTILMGRAKTGKSERVLRTIAALGDSSRQILLVPEHASHAAEVDLCAVCGDTASRHAEVLSFRALSTRVLARTGGLGDVALDAGGKLLTLQRALLETAPALKLYRRPSRKAAFLQEMLSLFDELESYAVTPELLAEKAEAVSGTTREKLRDLSLLYGAYEARLHRPGVDARSRMRRLCEGLELSGCVDDTDLFLDGFTYFNAQEVRAIEIFLRRAHSVTVTLLGEAREGRRELFDASYRTMELLTRLAASAGCASEVIHLTPPPAADALTHLERCFFGETVLWGAPQTAVRVRRAESLYDEVERTAGDIRRLAAAGRCRYRDIVVAARNMGEYEETIENVFARYDIPVYLSRRSNILETPVLSMIGGALSAVTGGFAFEDLFRCLKTGLAGLTRDECDRLENYVLTWEIHGAMWLRDVDWTANPDGYGAPWDQRRTEALADINALRARVRAPFAALSEGLKSADTAQEYVEVLYAFLEQVDVPGALRADMERQAAAGQLQRAEETGQLWDTLCAVLDQFVELLGGEVLTADEFVRLWRQVMTQYGVATIPASLDQVSVSEITRNDRHTAKYLFLLGASDQVLPSGGSSGGILNDDDRDTLASVDVRLAPRGMELLSIELQNLYAALAQPTCALTVSWPARDGSGGEVRPSFVIGRLLALFPDAREAESPLVQTARTPALEASGMRPGGALWNYFAAQEEAASALAAMAQAADYRRGVLSRGAVETLYGKRITLSASRAERVRSCHFAYFMEYGLRARERSTAAFDAPQIGTFLHFVLERVTRETMARGGFSAVEDAVLRELTETAAQEYERREYPNLRERSARLSYLLSRLRRAAWFVVKETAQELRESDFLPLEFELSFGQGGTLPAVQLRDPDGELRLTGKVDRVDGWLKDGKLYLRVVDYKSGKKKFDLADVQMGLEVQMLLYLFALQKEGAAYFGHPIEPAGVLYLPARDEILRTERSVTPEKLASLRAESLRRSGLVLRSGAVLTAMEHAALTEPHYLPLRLNRAGDITEGVATAEQMGRLGNYVERLLVEIGREVRTGAIAADPCCHGPGDSPCRYCRWRAACQFENGQRGEQVRYIRKLSPEEFWRQVEETDGKGGEDRG